MTPALRGGGLTAAALNARGTTRINAAFIFGA